MSQLQSDLQDFKQWLQADLPLFYLKGCFSIQNQGCGQLLVYNPSPLDWSKVLDVLHVVSSLHPVTLLGLHGKVEKTGHYYQYIHYQDSL